MPMIEIFVLSAALAMDAFAVAVCTGCGTQRINVFHYLRLAGAFGLFQFMMPVMGWFLGLAVRDSIETWDHWVAFALLVWIGGNMLRESWNADGESCATTDNTRGMKLLLLAIATSIDALAVGLSFSLLGIAVWGPSMIIGVVCAAFTVCGLYLGTSLARAARFGKWAEAAGGLVLVGIGIKILVEHNALG